MRRAELRASDRRGHQRVQRSQLTLYHSTLGKSFFNFCVPRSTPYNSYVVSCAAVHTRCRCCTLAAADAVFQARAPATPLVSSRQRTAWQHEGMASPQLTDSAALHTKQTHVTNADAAVTVCFCFRKAMGGMQDESAWKGREAMHRTQHANAGSCQASVFSNHCWEASVPPCTIRKDQAQTTTTKHTCSLSTIQCGLHWGQAAS